MKKVPNFPPADAGEDITHLKPPTVSPRPSPQARNDGLGFAKFRHGVDFVNKIYHPDFPHKGAGVHVPVWVTPALAHRLLLDHGHTGHVIPHPNIDVDNLTK